MMLRIGAIGFGAALIFGFVFVQDAEAVVKRCTRYNQQGKKIFMNCGTYEKDVAAQAQIKAANDARNASKAVTTQKCYMVKGALVCS